MAVQTALRTEPRTYAYIEFTGVIDADQFIMAIDDIHRLMDDLDESVSTIITFKDITTPWVSIIPAFPRIRSKLGHPNSTGILVLTGIKYRRSAAQVFAKVVRRLNIAASFEEALSLLDQLEAEQLTDD